ncbi:hypothetical protein D3C85_1281880 [compost metagenome]
MTKFCHSAVQQFRDHIDFTQVSGQAQEATAQRGDALDGFSRFNNVDPDDVAARFRETQRHTLAQTGITPSDDRYFTLQRK